jgi:hypothetical protein
MVCVKFDGSYPMKRIEEDLFQLRKEVEEGLYRYSNDHYYTLQDTRYIKYAEQK